MKHYPLLIGLSACLVIIANLCRAGTPETLAAAQRERDLARAEALLTSFKNDSAHLIVARLIEELKAQDQLDSPFGLRVRLAEARALEQDQQDEAAIRKLLEVKEAGQEKELWDLFARSCLVLANLYEKIGRDKSCLSNLRQAHAAISRHGLDSIYPQFATRISSYHRVFGDVDSFLFYAREALRTAPRFQLPLEEAVGHLLLSLLQRESAPEEALQHYVAAKRIYQELEDYTGCSYVYNGMADLYFRQKKFRPALTFADSTITMARKAITLGHERHHTIARAYRFRGEILRALGQPDSAWFYLAKGYEMELAFMEDNTREKIVEIDARYQDEKKARQIEEQTQLLRYERGRRNGLLAITCLVLLFAAILLFFYGRLRIANRKTREQAERLAGLDAAKSRFFANISHELRTPLTLLLGPVHSLLKDQQVSERQAHLLQMAVRSGKQLEQLINEILDLRKLEMGKMELDLKPTVLSAFFRRHLAQFESLAERQGICFSFELSVNKDLTARIDRAKCRQIVYNLLSNAFKFTPAGGRIEARVSVDDGICSLAVADTGPGIHPRDLPHVFDCFYQAPGPLPRMSSDEGAGGTGIGLALCREYARLFGGEITVESTLGEGSVFRVVFPVALVDQGPANPANALETPDTYEVAGPPNQGGRQEDLLLAPYRTHASKPAAPEPPGGEARPIVLIVEDNPDLQDYLRLVLSKKYHVLTADNGQMALDILSPLPAFPKGGGADWLPDSSKEREGAFSQRPGVRLVLSDLMMPVMDGYQFLERLKGDGATRHLPVIMLTARADVRDKLKALRIGVDDYLLKPFDEEELLARIDNLLRHQEARRRETPAEAEPGAGGPVLSVPEQEWLETFEAYVQHHLADDTLSVPGLAEEFAMSESTLLRQLKRLTGLSPLQYLQEMRLDAARRLLEDRIYTSVAQVASQVGYSNIRSFSRRFRRRFGKLPSELMGE